MASNIGIDFGSTYSMLSYYDEENDVVNGIQTENGSVYIPSVACMDEFGDLLLGQEARDEMRSDPTLTPYRAFKMLLHELNHEKVVRYGYQEVKPEEVASRFLRKYLDIAAEHRQVQQFDSAVICVPEHWTSSCVSMSGRAVLLNLCTSFQTENKAPLLKHIRVVTEPVAATAYYAYNYREQPFEGEVIVVDYGGGTLDVTLTSVTADREKNGAMEIDAIYRTGVGENHDDGQIGDAGLAYMEEVTKRALAAAGFANPKMDGNFLRVKDKLESELMNGTRKISDRIQQRYALGMRRMKNDQEVFTYAPYRKTRIDITYSMLYTVFEELIQPKLEKCLGEIKDVLVKGGSDLNDSGSNIKLAIVGGFGQFPLVQKAVWEFFRCSDTAMDITLDARGGGQDAISFGAALIAAGKVQVKITSKYSMGLMRTRKGKETFRYALRCGQGVDCSEIYPVCSNEDAQRGIKTWDSVIYTGSDDSENNPWIFAVNNDPQNFEEAVLLVPQPHKRRELDEKLRNAAGLYRAEMKKQGYPYVNNNYFFGISMNESDIYYLHVFPTHPGTGKRDEKPIVTVSLGDFPALFGPNVSLDAGTRIRYIE